MFQIASFEFLNTPEYIDPYIWSLPEDAEPFSMSFKLTGFGDNFFVNNASSIFWLYALNVLLFLFLYLPILATNKKTGRCASLRTKLEGYFFWNGILRFYIETFFDLVLAAALNVYTADWDSGNSSEKFSNYMSAIVLILSAVIFLICLIYFSYNFDAFKYDDFKMSTVLDGTRHNTTERREYAFSWVTYFIFRRLAFVYSVIFWVDFLWAQIALQIMVSVYAVIYLFYFWPLETPFANLMEVFNECTIVMLSYCLMCFTQWVPEVETRHRIGWVFVGVALTNILVHLTFLTYGSGHHICLFCKKKHAQKIAK